MFGNIEPEFRKVDENYYTPTLSGEQLYQLRCSLLHEVINSINQDKIKDNTNKIDTFIFVIKEHQDKTMFSECIGTLENNNGKKELYLIIDNLIQKLLFVIEIYIKKKNLELEQNIQITN